MEIQTSGRSIDSLLEKVLSMNILSSDYFKELYRLKTYHEVIDEIYNQVDHVEPWMTGNCRGPSSAFCLLYKFFTMKLTVKQMHGLLKHPDSPYIRAVSVSTKCCIGFLYLRYVADSKTLWTWFEPYIKDDEVFYLYLLISILLHALKTMLSVLLADNSLIILLLIISID
ncbi:hypothetical protein B296_00026865 [Ensete ventricosum]|uniref:Pre-mRNA-splicing factor 38 n=1 Tax=Ensete ventricosum TaxID=4639 RepID=A0A427AL48_ENSVE|nr:hypothetical protein B296_00026865 [Ensete ventricosum]